MCHGLYLENTSIKRREIKAIVFDLKLFSIILRVVPVCVTAITIIHSVRSKFSVSDECESIYGSGHPTLCHWTHTWQLKERMNIVEQIY